jgi:hypothetical protein
MTGTRCSCSGDIDLVPDFLTFSPGILGRASVAFSTHDLVASAAAQPHEGKTSTKAAQMNIFITADAPSDALNRSGCAKAILLS